MATDVVKKEIKIQFRQLEALILVMAGATLASLQIIHYVFLNSGVTVTAYQVVLDWLFGMSIITLLVHFSFREIYKIHNELVIQREQAAKAEKRIQHIIDTTQDVIFTLDKEGNFTFANKAIEGLCGYTLDRILTNNIQDVLAPEYRPFILEQLRRHKDIGGRHLYVDVLKKDGKKTPVEFSFLPIRSRSQELTGFQGIARDIEERREIEKAQKEKEHCLKAIARVGQVLLENRKDVPYKKILEILCNTSEIHSAFILLNDIPSSGKVSDILSNKAKPPAHASMDDLQNPKLYVSYVSGGSNGNGKSQPVPDLMSGDGLGRGFMELSKKEGAIISSSKGDASSLILPLMVNSQFAGVVGFDKKADSKGWKPVEVNLLAASANMISQALERQYVNAQVKLHFIQLTKMISRAMFAVDPYTVSHQERLASLSVAIGERVGLGAEELEWLRVGALLHDIGKAAVPNTILSKPGKLTDEEWVLIRSHVKRGHEMLQDMDLPACVMDMVLNHHERLDGSGYPNGVRGDKLSTESRILGICDVVEAMSSHRPYRPARRKDEIIEELKKGRDKIYDPRVVDILIDVVEKNEFDFDFATAKK